VGREKGCVGGGKGFVEVGGSKWEGVRLRGGEEVGREDDLIGRGKWEGVCKRWEG